MGGGGCHAMARKEIRRCPKCGGEFVDRGGEGEGIVCENGCGEITDLIEPGSRSLARRVGVEQKVEDMLRRAYRIWKGSGSGSGHGGS